MHLSELFQSTMDLLVNFVNQIGYLGIFIGMFIESTMIPLPSEVIMIPAGMAAAKGEMNFYLLIIFGISGNVLGAVFSYYLADFLGRPILFKIGKYFFVKEETIIKIEKFFAKHGNISVFMGRLLVGFRHFISLPAGLAKMDMKKFFFYTTLGSTIWTTILTDLGFMIGHNQNMIKEYLHLVIIGCVIFCAAITFIYLKVKK
ncbi:MAG: DedA family protein [Rickettsiales bacterium]|nr:DedA family protein [Rickettsiales bacterium]